MIITRLIVIHIALAIAVFAVPALSTFWGYGLFAWLLFKTLLSGNRGGWAHLGAAYFAGMEVWLRMTKAATPWEFGKVGGILLLGTALVLEGRLLRKPLFLLMGLLLIPGLLLMEDSGFSALRQAITFQMGGMILLVVTGIYFYRRPMNPVDFQRLLVALFLPIVMVLVQVLLRSPELREVQFGLVANFSASGGFGPNQVSTILGLGMVLVVFSWLFGLSPMVPKTWSIAFFLLLGLRALLTFSRGGLVAAILSLGVAYLVWMWERGLSFRRLIPIVVIGVLAVSTFLFVDRITGGVLADRFSGETWSTKVGLEEKDLSKMTSGRFDILLTDIEMWFDHPLWGVGLGMSNALRPDYGVRNISHMEQSRLLAEHGALGLIVLLLMVGLAWVEFQRRRGINRVLLTFFFLFSFLTMLHSATRLAVVGFTYGMAFITLIPSLASDPVYRKSSVGRGQQPLRSGAVESVPGSGPDLPAGVPAST